MAVQWAGNLRRGEPSFPKQVTVIDGENAVYSQVRRRRATMEGLRVGRNERCPCGSGKKFKQCCLHRGINRLTSATVPRALLERSRGPQPRAVAPSGPMRGGETIEATAGHPFWVVSGEELDKRPVPEDCPAEVPNAAIFGRWLNAVDLRVGDILFTREGRCVPVTHVAVRDVKTKVFNLQVEELANYAVGYSWSWCITAAPRQDSRPVRPVSLFRSIPARYGCRQAGSMAL